jgi:hypothetical protein
MTRAIPKQSVPRNDLNVFKALSLKGYRFLTCRHLSLLHFPSQEVCEQSMARLVKGGFVLRLFLPTIDDGPRMALYTLTLRGARELAGLTGVSPVGLATARKPSHLFLEHSLRISDFMCSMEAALKQGPARLLLWKSDRQLKGSGGRALRVPHPSQPGERIPVIPDGLFSLGIEGRVEHFFLEADRGTMSPFAIRKKMLGYVQLYRRGLHKQAFGLPHFRVLLVTTTPFRRDKLRGVLKAIGYCPNMFWFGLWRDVSPNAVLGQMWLRCRDQRPHSLLE